MCVCVFYNSECQISDKCLNVFVCAYRIRIRTLTQALGLNVDAMVFVCAFQPMMFQTSTCVYIILETHIMNV